MLTTMNILLIISLLALILAIIGTTFAIAAFIKIVGVEKSTHTIQYVDPEIEAANKEYIDNWATSDEAIEKQEKMYKEDLEVELPEFALSDEDKERFSF